MAISTVYTDEPRRRMYFCKAKAERLVGSNMS